jgi:hypothetical protein
MNTAYGPAEKLPFDMGQPVRCRHHAAHAGKLLGEIDKNS